MRFFPSDIAKAHCFACRPGSTQSAEEFLNLLIPCNLHKRRSCSFQICTEGSNPSLSATQSALQRNSAVLSPEIRAICPFFAIIPQRTGLRRTDCSDENRGTVPAFLCRAHEQSGFVEGVRRLECDQMTRIQRERVDFYRHIGKAIAALSTQTSLAS